MTLREKFSVLPWGWGGGGGAQRGGVSVTFGGLADDRLKTPPNGT